MYNRRPIHSMWRLGYKRHRDPNGKQYAVCSVCNKLLSNTSAQRLQMHRNKCKLLEQSIAFAECNPMSEIDGNVAKKVKIKDEPLNYEEENSPPSFLSPETAFQCEMVVNEVTKDVATNTNAYTATKFDNKCASSDSESSVSDSQISVIPTTSKKKINVFFKCKHNKSNKHDDSVSFKDSKEIDLQLAKLFFGCNIPANLVESEHFKDFCCVLRPSYKPPSKNELETTLLDEIYEKCDGDIKFDEQSVLMMDTWIDEITNLKHVVCMLQAISGEAIFLDHWEIPSEEEIDLKLARILNTCVKYAQEKYTTNIYAVVSNNAEDIAKIGCGIGVWNLSCNSHNAELLVKDLIPSTIISAITNVLKVFSDPDVENHLLNFGGSCIKLPSGTHCSTYKNAFDCFLKNIHVMKKILDDNLISLSENISNLLCDASFVNVIIDILELVDPVCVLIKTCELSTATIADAAEEWLSLNFPEKYTDASIVLQQKKECALNIYSLVANYLHPKYTGKSLTPSQKIQVEEFVLQQLEADGLNSLQHFKEKSDIFCTLFKKEGLSPKAFWSFAEIKHSSLARFAKKIVLIPASSAQLGKIFSNWCFEHKLNNRYTSDKLKKILTVYYRMNIRDKTDFE